MTFYQGLAVVLVKFWAATWIAWGLVSLLSIGIPELFAEERSQYVVEMVAPLASSLLIGVLAWGCARPLGTRIGGLVTAPEPTLGIGVNEFVGIGVFLIGLYTFASYAPDALVAAIGWFIAVAKQTDAQRLAGESAHALYDWARLAGKWAAVFFALVLMLRVRDLVRLFGWLREAGLLKPASVDEQESSA